MRKRVLSSILAIAMLLSLLPTTVFAAQNSAATVDGTSYQSLGSAFEAASDGSTITLSADVTQSEAITVNRDVTLDLYGNTLTMSKAFKVQDGATLTITDSTNTGKVIRTGSGALFNVQKSSSVVVNGGSYEVSGNFANLNGGQGTLSITGGGTFNKNVSSYVNKTVLPYGVKDGDTYRFYASWEDAYAAYEAGGDDAMIGQDGFRNVKTVTLDYANGTGQTETIKVAQNTSILLPDAGQKDGYSFAGWKSETSGTIYEVGQLPTISQDVTFTAQWTGEGVSIPYASFAKDGQVDYAVIPAGQYYTLQGAGSAVNGTFSANKGTTIQTPGLAGKLFLGWDYDAATYTFTAQWATRVDLGTRTYGGGEAKDVEVPDGSTTVVVNPDYFTASLGNGEVAITTSETLKVGTYTYATTADAPNVIKIFDGSSNLVAAFNVYVKVVKAEQPAEGKAITVAAGQKVDAATGLSGVAGDPKITYSSSDKTVATVQNGKITGKKAGTATITATIGATTNHKKATVQFKVTVTAETVKVAFDLNGGPGTAPATQDVAKGSTAVKPSKIITRDGYAFLGWSKNKDATAADWTFGPGGTEVTEDVTLYAVWQANQFTVTFDPKGGTLNGNAPQTVAYGGTLTNPGTPTREGYVFTGWYNTDETTAWDFTTRTVQSNLTLTAGWTEETYTFTYAVANTGAFQTATFKYGDQFSVNPNGGSYYSSTEVRTFTAQDFYTGEFNLTMQSAPTKEGATFDGWSWDSKTSTFTAQWNQNQVTITYIGNGGTGNEETTKTAVSTQGTNYQLASENLFTRPGYTFVGWGTKQDGTGERYPAGKYIMLQQDITFYAQWAEVSYTVTFDADNGQENTEQTVTAQTGFKVTQPEVPTKEGYTFDGWMYQGEYWNFDTPVSVNATFTAVWVPKQYNVTFDCNGGTINGEEIQTYTGTYGKDAAPWAQGIVQRQGYTFAGWSQARNGEVAFDPDDRFPADWTQDITLYAVWVANGQEVTYKAYSEDGATAGRVVIPYDTEIVINPDNGKYQDGSFTSTSQFTHTVTGETTLQDPTRTGYEFLGWTYDAEDQTFTAKWGVQQYTVYFHGNGGTVAGKEVYSVAGPYGEAKAPFNTSVLVREGYTFQGWAITADEDATVRYSPTASFPWTWEKEETNLYAVWTPNKYTVTFDGNGGTVAGKTEYSVTKKYGADAPAFADGKVLREGAKFLGWSADSDATVATYGPRDSIRWTFAEDTTLYAVWDVYDLTFQYKDSGTGNLTTLELPYGTEVTVVPNGGSFGNGEAANYTKVLNQDDYLIGPDRSGYTFLGWTYDATTHTFTAQWEAITYTVTFDANGGEGTMEPQTFQAGVKKALSKNAFTKDEAVFVGWSTEKDGGGEGWSFTDQQEITFENISSNLTLYAQWKTNAYSFTYWKYNGGSDPSWDNTLAFEAGEVVNVNPVGGTYNGHDTLYSMTISSDPDTQELTYDISRPGYTFLGWKYTANTKTFVAKWEQVKYTITFDGNGGTVNGEFRQDVSATYGTDLDPWNPDVLVREGYTFQGWSRNANGSVFLDPDDRIPCSQWTENVTLYAIWEVSQYTISYDKYRANQDTSLWTTTAPIPYGTQITIDLAGGTYGWAETIFTLTGDTDLPKPTKAGCEFLGWKYVAKTHTFRAQWEEMTFTVTFDANGGTGEMDPQTFRANEPQYLTDNVFTKEGATFAGWNTAQDWSGTDYTDRQQVTFRETDQSMTLFAKWETIQYTVTFDANGGQWTNNDVVRTKTVDYQTAVQAPNDPSRTGYVFAGWVREDGRDWNFDWTVGNNLTLKAKWVEATYEFTYPAFNDWETPIDTTMTVTFGEQFTVNLNGGDSYYTHQGDFSFTVDETEATHALDGNAVRAGYDFAGWSYDAGSKTFTANWAEKTYSVTFNANGGFFNDKSTTSTVEVTQNKYVDLPDAGDVSREGGYVLLGWSEKQNGNLQYDLSTVSNIPYDQNKGNLILYAVWAQVVDFGTVPYGTAPLETVDYDAAVYSCPNASDQSFFKMSVDGEDTTVLRIRPDSELAPSKVPYVDLIRVVLNDGEIHYIQAKATVVPKEMTISTDLNESKLYTVGETFRVFVTAAPGQDLTLDCAGAGVSLECVSELAEVAETPGTYVATYEVVKIPADQQELTFTVKDNTYDATATLEKTINLRTLVIVTVNNVDGTQVSIPTMYLGTDEDSGNSKQLPLTWNEDLGKYTALADKASGWDYVYFQTADGREVFLRNTTVASESITEGIQANDGLVEVEYTFGGYTIAGNLYINDVAVPNVSLRISGNYGDAVDLQQLINQAWQPIVDRYPNAKTDKFDISVLLNGSPVQIKTFGETNYDWGSDNTIYVNVYATAGYHVDYDLNWQDDSNDVVYTEFVKHGETATGYANPSREGFKFAGWYVDPACTTAYDFTQPVTNNMILYAKWEANVYLVQFNNGYGGIYEEGTPWAPQEIPYNGILSKPTEVPTRPGYTFNGWYLDPEGTKGCFNENGQCVVTTDMVIYAGWKQNDYWLVYHNVDLASNKDQFQDYEIHYGDVIRQPVDPIREGYTFQGWYLDEAYTEPATFPITVGEKQVDLYAKWVEAVTVTFNLNGGTSTDDADGDGTFTLEIAKGSALPDTLATPTHPTFVFGAWYADADQFSDPWNMEAPINESMTLTAGWEKATGVGKFFNTTQTSTYVMIRVQAANGNWQPATGIEDLTLSATNQNGLIFDNVHMQEILPESPNWQSDWDPDYAYYTASFASTPLTGSGQFSLTAAGYDFTVSV